MSRRSGKWNDLEDAAVATTYEPVTDTKGKPTWMAITILCCIIALTILIFALVTVNVLFAMRFTDEYHGIRKDFDDVRKEFRTRNVLQRLLTMMDKMEAFVDDPIGFSLGTPSSPESRHRYAQMIQDAQDTLREIKDQKIIESLSKVMTTLQRLSILFPQPQPQQS